MIIIRSLVLYSITLIALRFSVQAQQDKENKERPNIIFFLIDDQRYDHLSMLKHPFIQTPNIDNLAKGGVYFDEAFVTTSLCSPSRASIVTGQYAHKHDVIDNNTDLNPKTPTYPRELQKAGYNTGFVGKWHMGEASNVRRPGFDYWVSFEGQGRYIDPKLNVNGDRQVIKGHMTDVLTDLAVDYTKVSHLINA